MTSSNQSGVWAILRTLGSWLQNLADSTTRPDTTHLEEGVASLKGSKSSLPLEGIVEPLGDTNKYYLGASIGRRAGEKGPYYIATEHLISFIRAIYPDYVAGDYGKHVQVLFQSDKASQSKTFSNLRGLTEYVQELDGMVVCDPIISISYSGTNKDVPKQILIERRSISFSATDYSVFVEAAKNYNLKMIDVCAGKLFSGRHKLYPPPSYR